MKFELNKEDFELLLISLGVAAGVATRDGNPVLFLRFLKLANTINKDNPDWTPYEVPNA
jgi:hypothetical protein